MDAYEATRIVFSRIQNLDPDNASRIMGLLLIQDHGEKEMIRLAFGPEALVHSLILKARKELGLASNSPPTPSTPPSPSPSPFFSRQTSSRLLPPALTIPNPSSSWSALSDLQSPDELVAATSSAMNSSSLPFYGNGAAHQDVMDELQLQDQLSFLNDGPKNQDFYYPRPDLSLSPGSGGWGHRRSCSVSDVCLNSDDPASGFGWKPCLYYARGYCKNGSSCRFLHGDSDGGAVVGSPSKLEMMEHHELLRSKSAHQQRLAAASQLMASAFPYSPKTMNLLLQQNDTQRAAAALISGEDMQKYGRSRLERSDFSSNGGVGMVNPASRQIYLTFPADSTFREEDVSNYFSIYGPVQDVRIPYQQKRMFGFVTFVYPETVKLILAKGNPHFVCDARVLVKPYKEKGKVPDNCRKQQQQMERGEFSPCGTPTGLDSRDIFDLPSPGGGASMFYNSAQDMLWRRKLEEQALEIQSRRLMNLQLLDVKKHHHHRTFSTGGAHSPSLFSPHHPFHGNQDVVQENENRVADEQTGKVCNGKEENINGQESLEHNLPDSPFASPTKAAANYFSNGNGEAEKDANNSNSLQIQASSLDMASFKSFNCQIPSFSSGHGAIGGGMFGGSSFPVGI